MVAQTPLPFSLSSSVPEKMKTSIVPPVKGEKENKPVPEVKPVAGAERFLPLPKSKALSEEQREKEAMVIAWLKEQDEPVTITDISTIPRNRDDNGDPVIGDLLTHGGLGMQQSTIRLILKRLHQQKRVTRLPPRINRNETAHLWVEGWVDMGDE